MKDQNLVLSLNIITYLKRKKRAHLSELKERFGVDSERLIEILESITDIGIPPYGGGDYIQIIFEGDGYVRMGSSQHFRGPVKLSLEEVTALRLWLVSTSAGSQPYREIVRSLLEKIEDHASVESGLSMDLDRVREVERRSQTISVVDRALKEKNRIKLEYFSTYRDKLRFPQVEPHGLVDREGVWFLIGRDCGDGQVKDYRIDRIRSVMILEEKFETIDQNLDVHVQPSLKSDDRYPCVTVRARGPLRRELESIGKDIKKEGDHVVAEVPVASIPWFLSWLLMYPEHLDVLDATPIKESLLERVQLLKKNC